MEYKLIAIDMDGTLLDPEKKVRDATLFALQAAMDAGLIVTVATGRPIQGVERYETLFSLLEAPLITYNGAVILKPQSKEVLYERTLTPQAAAEIISLGKTLESTPLLWSRGELFIFAHTDVTAYYAEMSKSTPIVIDDEAALMQRGITKILWFDEAENILRAQAALEGAGIKNTAHCTSSPRFLEMFHSDASKGNALAFLGDMYHIPPAEIIAIGDEMNDISMLQYAGLGVAMGNARDEVKAAADFVTLSNGEDGVAHVIHSFVTK